MTPSSTPPESFEFTLMRARATDADGQLVNEDSADPDDWARADAATGMEVVGLGRGRLTVTEPDARAFVASHLLIDPAPGISYIRATVVMDSASERAPAMADLIGVMLPDGSAVMFEVMLSADDLASEPTGDAAVVFVRLQAGEVVLQSRPDLGVLDTASVEGDSEARNAIH
jgi:hypothetical protein